MEIKTKYNIGDLVGTKDAKFVGIVNRIEINTFERPPIKIVYHFQNGRFCGPENELFLYVRVCDETDQSETNKQETT